MDSEKRKIYSDTNGGQRRSIKCVEQGTIQRKDGRIDTGRL